jgi:DNA repair protein RecN (Recombination protein N)
MLRELHIKNFAVIDEVALEFDAGLNVLTGETGAGKTIILSALALILGNKVSTDVIRHGEDEASVDALFAPLPAGMVAKLEGMGFETGDELIIRRIISRSGRNRAYVNGSVCALSAMTEVGSHLVHIYGQHEHHTLLKADAHLSLLTAFGGLEDKAAEMKIKYFALAQAWNRLSRAKETLKDNKREEEAVRCQFEEIRIAALKPGEEDELKAKRELLVHAERLLQGCKEGEDLLYESPDAMVSRLGRYGLRLHELVNIDPKLQVAADLLESAQAQLEEAASVLRRYAARADFDPESLEKVEDRLAEISRIKRKYNASVEEILGLQQKLETSLKSMQSNEAEISSLEREFEEARKVAWDCAAALSAKRLGAAKHFKKEIEREVKSLGMPGTIFELRFPATGHEHDEPPYLVGGKKITEQGIDEVEFYFSPNPGEPVKPLAKIASGGELSRVMLAIRSMVLTKGDIQTLLFDEVDAGVGGAVAEIVGKKLRRVAQSFQVICVTHLPQIAALANSHCVVRKEVVRGRTLTTVKRLSERERVGEVARMLGGIKITETTKRYAEEIVKRGD